MSKDIASMYENWWLRECEKTRQLEAQLVVARLKIEELEQKVDQLDQTLECLRPGGNL